MDQAAIVPFISRSTLFLRGMIAQCPALEVLDAHAGPRADRPASRDRIMEKLVRSMPGSPRVGGEDIARLASLTEAEVTALPERQTAAADAALHRIWRRTWAELTGDDREFAVRCANLLTELYRLSRAGIRNAASAP